MVTTVTTGARAVRQEKGRLNVFVGKTSMETLVPAKEVSTGFPHRERSGSVVECLTRDRRAVGSSLTGVTALWSLSKTHLS